MENSLPPPPLFDRRFDRIQHDRTMWTALAEGHDPEQPDVPLPLWNILASSSPVELYGYSYPQAYHWMEDSDNPNSRIGVFDFPCRLNFGQPESSFGKPYFSLHGRNGNWNHEDIEDARLVVTCEVLPQDLQSPYPESAKQRSAAMYAMLQAALEHNEARAGEGTASPFAKTMSNGQLYFVLESGPVFQHRAEAAPRQDITADARSLATLSDPQMRYCHPSFDDYVFNPPPIYDELSNLVLPHQYQGIFQNGDVVMVRSAICVVQNQRHRQYKHRLLQMYRIPSSRG